jgi:hypothetical protein
MAINLEDIKGLLLEAIDIVQDKKTLEEAGKELVPEIQKRVRIGKGVNKPEGSPTALKPLEPKTKLIRKDLKRKGLLSGPGATPAKSGVNRTGKTLEGMHAEAKDGELEIKLTGDGQRVALELAKIDSQRFTFMNLSKGETKRLVDFLEDKVKSLSKKLNKA